MRIRQAIQRSARFTANGFKTIPHTFRGLGLNTAGVVVCSIFMWVVMAFAETVMFIPSIVFRILFVKGA